MSKSNPDPRKRYEALMRNAGESRRALSARQLANERRIRKVRERLEEQRTDEERTGRVQQDLREHAENLHVAGLIERELVVLKLKLSAATDREEKMLLKAEIAHLQTLKSNLKDSRRRNPPRKPPESGIAVPAISPTGPLPKQGGAEAPLDFDR